MSAHLGFHVPLVGFTSTARPPPSALADSTLMKEYQSSGLFWLPDNPTQAFWGNLHYVPGNGTSLTIDGQIAGSRSKRLNLKIPELHGRLFNGTPCVAKDVWGSVESFIARGEFFRSLLQARLFLFGIEPAVSRADRFAMSSLRFSHLNDWFERPLKLDYQHESFDECLVSFGPPRTEAMAEFEGEAFKLDLFCARTVPSGAGASGVKFTFNYKLMVIPDRPQPLAWHMSIAGLLREFFMFLVGSGIYTLEMQAFSGPTLNAGETHIFPTATVPMVVRLDPVYFYSHHAKIKPHFEKLLGTWLREAERLAVVRHTLSDLLTVDGISQETVFTRVVQTMEHLHGLVAPDQHRYVSKRVWRRFAAWLERQFPECWSEGNHAEHAELRKEKAPLVARIKGINSLSFRSGIRALFDMVPRHELMPVIDNPRDTAEYLDALIPRIEATRHYLTHFSSEQRERAFPIGELEIPTLQCWSVLIFTLARFLGLGDDLSGELALAARKTMFLVGTKTQL